MLRVRYNINGQEQAEIKIVNKGHIELGLYEYEATDLNGKKAIVTHDRNKGGWQLVIQVLNGLYDLKPETHMITQSEEE